MAQRIDAMLTGTAGEYMESATLVEWCVAVGERVHEGQCLAVVETAKAASEVPSPAAGIVAERVVEVGADVALGAVLCRIETEGAPPSSRPPSSRPPAAATTVRRASVPAPLPPARSGDDGFVRASPLARRLAREQGLDLAAIAGTGPEGRVQERDVLAATREASTDPDPQLRSILKALGAGAGGARIAEMTPGEVRALADRHVWSTWAGPAWPVALVRDFDVPGAADRRPARLYDPLPGASTPVLVYFHGGGGVVGGLHSHDAVCRRLAVLTAAKVLAVDYRLAPEHPFPAAEEDARAALSWTLAEAATLGGDPARIGVVGDSFGAGLTLAAALGLAPAARARLKVLGLIYGAFGRGEPAKGSRAAFGSGRLLLSNDEIAWYWRHRFAEGRVPDWRAELLEAELAGLPPVRLAAAALDPVLDDSRSMAHALRTAGVPATLVVWPRMVHGALHFLGAVDALVAPFERYATSLREALAP